MGSGADLPDPYLCEQILTYIGNKRSLLPFIGEGVALVKQALGKERLRTFDVFSGSGVVARYLKAFSEHLTAADIERYSDIGNRCYLSNRSEVDIPLVRSWIDRMNRAGIDHPQPGIISELYAPMNDEEIQAGERVFYTKRNALFLDTARQIIDQAPAHITHHLMAPLLFVASVHANTSGVFKGFYKNSDTGIGQFGGNGKDALTRIRKHFTIPYPIYSQHECPYDVRLGDANTIITEQAHVDVAYIDPPYNQHPYGSNYFMLNLIASYERPRQISEVSGIPTDWTRSAYNRRRQAPIALAELTRRIDAKFLLISFNSEGFISKQEMLDTLTPVGTTTVLETSYNTFRGSRNLSQRDIHLTEYLYLVDKR